MLWRSDAILLSDWLMRLLRQTSHEVQERSRGKREQRRGPLVAAREAGLLAFCPAGPCRVDADQVARNRSADLRGGKRSADGGLDRVFGAAQRAVNSDRRGAAEPTRSGLDSRVEILVPDVAGDRAVVEEIAGLKVEPSVEFNRLPRERPREVGRHVRVDVVVVSVFPGG
jgi:hypothetical protein